MERNINISVGKIIAVNIVAEHKLMKKSLFDLLTVLKQKYLMIYKCVDTDLHEFQKHFADKSVSYKENDANKFIQKTFPELTVEEISDENIEFISNNWNGSFERSDIIIATTDLQKSNLIDVKTFNPAKCLKDPNVFFVVTDGENPDEYCAFSIYMRQEDFPFVYESIISGIKKITAKDSK